MIPRRNVYLIEIDSHILSYGWFNIWVIDTQQFSVYFARCGLLKPDWDRRSVADGIRVGSQRGVSVRGSHRQKKENGNQASSPKENQRHLGFGSDLTLI
jgi:hypothetical protein